MAGSSLFLELDWCCERTVAAWLITLDRFTPRLAAVPSKFTLWPTTGPFAEFDVLIFTFKLNFRFQTDP